MQSRTAQSARRAPGEQVCVLERGRELQNGAYPDAEAEASAEMPAGLPSGHTARTRDSTASLSTWM